MVSSTKISVILIVFYYCFLSYLELLYSIIFLFIENPVVFVFNFWGFLGVVVVFRALQGLVRKLFKISFKFVYLLNIFNSSLLVSISLFYLFLTKKKNSVFSVSLVGLIILFFCYELRLTIEF